MKISLSDHFTLNKLIRFTLPSILMVMFGQLYGIVDTIFISNYAGKTAFAAVILICPLWDICCNVSFILGSGGGAYISKTLGEGNNKKANQFFSLLIYTSITLGIIISILGCILAPMFLKMLGAEGELLDQGVLYLRTVLLMHPFRILQIEFCSLFVTAEKPKLGFYFSLATGLTNVIFDALLIGYFNLGLVGAAIATNIAVLVGGGVPLFYFGFKNSSLLRLCKCTLDFKALFRAVTNGISEFVAGISWAIMGSLYNYQLMTYYGENGVAVFGVILNSFYLFQSIFWGYNSGCSPLFGFNFGARNAKELKNLLIKSLSLILFFSIFVTSIAEIFSGEISDFFLGYDKDLFDLSKHALQFCAISLLFIGFNEFGSSFFTALSDGITSAKIAGLRSFLIKPSLIIILPMCFGKEGIWWAVVIAEAICIFIILYYFVKKKDLYLHPNPDY